MSNQLYTHSNNNVALALKSDWYTLNLVDNRVVLTMVAILRALYTFYFTDMT